MFELFTPSTRLILTKKFQNSKFISFDVNPDIWITKLELLRKCLKTLKVDIEDKDFVIDKLISNLPREFNSLVKAIEENISNN
jgi:gag-polypeptide of LTR copia-type